MELSTFAISRLSVLTLKYRILPHPVDPALAARRSQVLVANLPRGAHSNGSLTKGHRAHLCERTFITVAALAPSSHCRPIWVELRRPRRYPEKLEDVRND